MTTCVDLEILLADYLDGTLAAAEKTAVEAHLAQCAACAEFARDAASAMSFMERAAVVDVPPALVNRILFEATQGFHQASRKPSWIVGLLGPAAGRILQPRFAMGMAMAALSFTMIFRYTGLEVRQLTLSDLRPTSVWAGAGNRAHRVWDRAVKSYENVRLVYQVQAQLDEWSRETPDQTIGAQDK
jgi:anti-sigma factor RsiW